MFFLTMDERKNQVDFRFWEAEFHLKADIAQNAALSAGKVVYS